MLDVMKTINEYAWIIGNLLVSYTAVTILAFVIMYAILFDPRATIAGKFIFRFMLSLVGITVLVFIGTFIDPSHDREWYNLPADVEAWRPLLRVVIYGYVAYTITSLSCLLVIRKWYPRGLKNQQDLSLVVPRHTTEIPIVK